MPLRPTLSFRRFGIVALCLLLCAASANLLAADEVVMRNGDRLSGELIRQGDGQLELKTSYAGTLTIDWTAVAEVRLDTPVAVLLDDDKRVEVTSVAREGAQVRLQPSDARQPMMVSQDEVAVIRPEPWETGNGHRLSGRINAALTDETGNSESSEIDVDLSLSYRRRWDEIETFGQLEYDTTRGVKTTENWTLLNKYTRRFPKTPWYGSFWLRLKHDRFADIKLRYLTGPGLGYQFDAGEKINLSAEIGPIYLHEDFYEVSDNTFWGPGLFIDYEQSLVDDGLTLYLRGMGFSALSDSDKDLWVSWAGLRMPLTGGFVGSVEYEIDYDSSPALESKTTDKALRLKLGYEF